MKVGNQTLRSIAGVMLFMGLATLYWVAILEWGPKEGLFRYNNRTNVQSTSDSKKIQPNTSSKSIVDK